MNRRGFLQLAAAAPLAAAVPQAASAAISGKAIAMQGGMGVGGAIAGNGLCQAVSTSNLIPQFMRVALDMYRDDQNARGRWNGAWHQYRKLRARHKVAEMRPRAIYLEFDPWEGAREKARRAAEHKREQRGWSSMSWETKYRLDRERDYAKAPAWCKDEGRQVDYLARMAKEKLMENMRFATAMPPRYLP
jgi:hypothetical protein